MSLTSKCHQAVKIVLLADVTCEHMSSASTCPLSSKVTSQQMSLASKCHARNVATSICRMPANVVDSTFEGKFTLPIKSLFWCSMYRLKVWKHISKDWLKKWIIHIYIFIVFSSLSNTNLNLSLNWVSEEFTVVERANLYREATKIFIVNQTILCTQLLKIWKIVVLVI